MTNQVKNYFNLKQDDIVIVSLGKRIVIAKVVGKNFFNPLFTGGHGANQISVEFFRKDNKVIRIPRVALKQNLESRLKLRTTIGDLSRFSDEIEHLIQNLNNYGNFEVNSSFQEKLIFMRRNLKKNY